MKRSVSNWQEFRFKVYQETVMKKLEKYMPKENARVLAVVIPILNPVKDPGPDEIAIPLISLLFIPDLFTI